MPTYDYRCAACGHTFEQFQPITAPPTRKCPVCRKLKVQRLIGTGAGLIFKGSGFYITDYRSESYKSAAKGESSNGKADAKSTAPAAKTESKPAAKTDKPAAKT